MMTEVQQQLVAAYEELAITRAACNAVMASMASVCAEYGVDTNILAAVNERARRTVAHLLPALAASLTDSAKQVINPVENSSDEDSANTRAPRPARRSPRSVS